MTKQTANKILVLVSLAVLSLIAVFGVYNTFGPNLVSMISNLETIEDKTANGGILVLFIGMMVYLNTIYTRTKSATEKIKLFFVTATALIVIAGLMYMSSSILYPLISMAVIGVAMVLFKMMFDTINITGVFAVLALFIAVPVIALKSGLSDSATIVTIVQSILAVTVFVGATYPRLRALLFQIRASNVTNIEESNEPHSH